MRYVITLLLLLLPSVCFGFGVGTVGSLGSGVVASGGSCATQPVMLDQTGAFAVNSIDIDDTSTIYALKITGDGRALYSVTYKTGTAAQGATTTADVYVSASSDFSGTLISSDSIITPAAISTNFIATFDSQPVLENGVDYYIGILNTDGTWGTRFGLTMINDGTDNAYSSTTGYATLTQNANYSLWAEVKVCD